MPCIRFSDLTYLITESLYSFTNLYDGVKNTFKIHLDFLLPPPEKRKENPEMNLYHHL